MITLKQTNYSTETTFEVPLVTRLPGKSSKVASALVINKSPQRPHDDLWQEQKKKREKASVEGRKRGRGHPRKNKKAVKSTNK